MPAAIDPDADHDREQPPRCALALDQNAGEFCAVADVAIDAAEIARRKDIERKKLRRMIAYAETAGCLRATILRYFSDPAAEAT